MTEPVCVVSGVGPGTGSGLVWRRSSPHASARRTSWRELGVRSLRCSFLRPNYCTPGIWLNDCVWKQQTTR